MTKYMTVNELNKNINDNNKKFHIGGEIGDRLDKLDKNINSIEESIHISVLESLIKTTCFMFYLYFTIQLFSWDKFTIVIFMLVSCKKDIVTNIGNFLVTLFVYLVSTRISIQFNRVVYESPNGIQKNVYDTTYCNSRREHNNPAKENPMDSVINEIKGLYN